MAWCGLRSLAAPSACLAACLALAGCAQVAELASLPARAAQSPPLRSEVFGAPERVLPGKSLDPAACGAPEAGALVGDHFTVLAALSLPGTLRILWPGQSVTSDAEPARLNAQVSEAGLIRRVFCG
jgi:hypothetical protein